MPSTASTSAPDDGFIECKHTARTTNSPQPVITALANRFEALDESDHDELDHDEPEFESEHENERTETHTDSEQTVTHTDDAISAPDSRT